MSIGRHTTYNIVGAAAPLAVSLLTVPLYLKLIGPDRYGVLSIAWLLLGYFGLFDLGLGRATSFRIAALRDADGQARADTFWAALLVNAGMGAAGGVALWAAGAFFFGHMFKVDEALRPEILAATPLLAAAVPISTLMGVLTGALQGREKFLQINLVSSASTIFFQLAPLALAATLGPNLVLILGAAVVTRLLALLVLAHACHKEITRGWERRLQPGELPTLMKYGGWVTVTSIFGPLLTIVDRFAIGAVLGAKAVATYNVPFQLAKQIAIVPSALVNALFPRLSAADPAEQQRLGEGATLTLASLISLPVLGGIFLIEPFMHVWIGPELGTTGASVGRALLIGFWANAFALVPYTRLQASGRPDLVTKILLAEIPVYLVGLYLGMTYFGVLGAAVALSARFTLDYALLTWAADRSFVGWKSLSVNFAILIAGAWCAHQWTIADAGWWISAVLLALACLMIGWRTLPAEIKREAFRRLRRYGMETP
jgi:O-antigen/teichoic acid export membrane protein